MIIDDEALDQRLATRVLTRSGRVEQVLCYSYPDEALEFLGEEDRPEIDVILLDINMPRLNGFEFLEEATARYGDAFAKAVVVMLTTSLNPRDHARADGFNVVRDFMSKPLTGEHIDRLCDLVASAT